MGGAEGLRGTTLDPFDIIWLWKGERWGIGEEVGEEKQEEKSESVHVCPEPESLTFDYSNQT